MDTIKLSRVINNFHYQSTLKAPAAAVNSSRQQTEPSCNEARSLGPGSFRFPHRNYFIQPTLLHRHLHWSGEKRDLVYGGSCEDRVIASMFVSITEMLGAPKEMLVQGLIFCHVPVLCGTILSKPREGVYNPRHRTAAACAALTAMGGLVQLKAGETWGKARKELERRKGGRRIPGCDAMSYAPAVF